MGVMIKTSNPLFLIYYTYSHCSMRWREPNSSPFLLVLCNNIFIMEKEALERISIVMEVVAFFLGGTELIGSERIKRFSASIKAIDPAKVRSKTQLVFRNIAVIAIISIGAYYLNLKGNSINEILHKPNKSAFDYVLLIITGATILIVIVAAIFTNKIDELSSRVEKGLLKICLFFVAIPKTIISLFPIEGIMIMLGAILFVAAKAIAFIATYYSKISN